MVHPCLPPSRRTPRPSTLAKTKPCASVLSGFCACASKRKALCLLSESVLAHARSKHIHTHTQWSRLPPRVAIPSGSAHRGASVCEPGALLPLCNQHVGGGRKLAGISCHHQEHHPGLWTCIRPSLDVGSPLLTDLRVQPNSTARLQAWPVGQNTTVTRSSKWLAAQAGQALTRRESV